MASIVYFADGKQLLVDDTVVHCLVCDEWYEDGTEHICPGRETVVASNCVEKFPLVTLYGNEMLIQYSGERRDLARVRRRLSVMDMGDLRVLKDMLYDLHIEIEEALEQKKEAVT